MSAARPRKELDISTYEGRFAARLRELREKRNLSVEQLAALTGIPRTTLYNWEQAIRIPTIDRFPELAEALKLKSVRLLFPEK